MFMLSLLQSAGLDPQERESLDTITADLLNILKIKNHAVYMHSLQVANYSISIAAKLGMPNTEIEQIRHAALLHDIGMLAIQNCILSKLPYLTTREQSQYKNHCVLGSNMLENIPCCQEIVPYIRYHHERWDGSGYPKHMRGANIPFGARIIAVADYYDIIINPSTEYWAKTKKEAVRELFSASGILFDPEIVKAFIEVLG